MTTNKNLFEKIQAVANDVKNIEKDMTVGKGYSAYQAVSDQSVTLKIKEAEKKHRVVSIPVGQELVHQEVIKTLASEDKETVTYSFIVKMTTKIVDLDNTADFIEIESFGHGLDRGDKGFGKASTYARKYALLNAYKVATGEDPDNDPSKGQDAKREQPLRDRITNYMEQNTDYKINVFTHYGVSDYHQLSDSQVTSIAKSIHKSGIDI